MQLSLCVVVCEGSPDAKANGTGRMLARKSRPWTWAARKGTSYARCLKANRTEDIRIWSASDKIGRETCHEVCMMVALL